MKTKTELFKNVKEAEVLVEFFADHDYSPDEYAMLFENNINHITNEDICYLVEYFTGCKYDKAF